MNGKQTGAQRVVDLTQGSPVGLILRFAAPILLGYVFQQVYTLSDTMIAGRVLGDDALAAVGASATLYSLLLSLVNGMTNGCSLVVGRIFGMGDAARVRRATAVMLLLVLGVSVVLTAAVLLTAPLLMRFLNTPERIFDDALAYMTILFGGLVTTVLYNGCASFMRALGNSRAPLIFLMIACGANLVMDVVFMAVLGWGVAGAALATVLAQALSAALSVAYILRHFGAYLPGKAELRPERALLREMTTSGLSMAMMYSVYSVGSVMMGRAINGLGEQVVTAHTTARRVLEAMMNPTSAAGAAAAAFVSQNRGAGQWQRVRQGVRTALVLVMLWSTAVLVLLWSFDEAFIRILSGTEDGEIIRLGAMNLCINAPLYYFQGALVTLRQVLQSMGRKIVPVMASCIELLMKLACAAWVVPVWGYLGASWGEPSTWVACAVFIIGAYGLVRRRMYPDLADQAHPCR